MAVHGGHSLCLCFYPHEVKCPVFYLYRWGRVQVRAWSVIEVELIDGNLLCCHNPVALNSVPSPKAWPKATSSTRRGVGDAAMLSCSETHGVLQRSLGNISCFYVSKQQPPAQKSVSVLSSSPLSTLKLLLFPAPAEQKYMAVWFPCKSNLTFGAEW